MTACCMVGESKRCALAAHTNGRVLDQAAECVLDCLSAYSLYT